MKQASFDNWTIIFLFFALLAFLLGIFFSVRNVPAKKANRLLAAYIILYGIALVEYVLFWTGYISKFEWMGGISICFPFVFGPLLLVYVKTVFGCVAGFKKENIHFLSFALLFIFCMLLIHWQGFAKKLMTQRSFGLFFQWLVWAGLAHMIGYSVAIILFIRKQGKVAAIKKWAYFIATFFILLIASHLLYHILSRFSFFNTAWDYFVSVIMATAVLCTAWFGFAHPAIFQGYAMAQAVTSPPLVIQAEQATLLSTNGLLQVATGDTAIRRYKNSGLTPSAAQRLADRLTVLMEKDKVYRENDISLDKLAALLNTGRHHLSQVINEHYQVNFYEYINLLRIEEATQLLSQKTKKELNVIEVAYLVGFNNRISFATAFKKVTGLTPTAYRQQQK